MQNCAWACVGVAGSAAVALIPNMLLNTIPNSATDLAGKALSDVFKNAYQTYRLTSSILILVFIIAVCLACILFYLYFKKKSSNAITADILKEDIENCLKSASKNKAAVLGVMSKDTVKQIKNGFCF